MVTKSDTKDCHRLGNTNIGITTVGIPGGITTVRFTYRKFCNDNLGKNLNYTKILTSLNLVFSRTQDLNQRKLNSLQPASHLEM